MPFSPESFTSRLEAHPERHFFPKFETREDSTAFECALTTLTFEDPASVDYREADEYVCEVMLSNGGVTTSNNIGELRRELYTLVDVWRYVYYAVFHQDAFIDRPRIPPHLGFRDSDQAIDMAEARRNGVIRHWRALMYSDTHPDKGRPVLDIREDMAVILPKGRVQGTWLIGGRDILVPYR